MRIAAIMDRGFREDRRGRRWLLDLVDNRERIAAMTAESRERMRAEGIVLLTLDRDADPDKYRRVWRMNEEAVQDVPTTLPNVEESFADTMRWLRAPGMHEDRFWIAGSDFFNLHAAGCGSHEDGFAGDAINDDAKIELAVDGQGLFNK